MIAAPEELAQSCQAQSVEQQFYRGLSVLISLNGPLTAAVWSMICVRYSDTERKYNEYPVPATSVHQSSKSQRDGYAVDPFQKMRARAGTWMFPISKMKLRRDFSQDHRCF
jgi:hypothetical protein